MDDWNAWIGREELRHDRVDPGLVARWCATLDRGLPTDGTAPQALHWCLGLPDTPTAQLADDGHPRRNDDPGSFLPPIPLPRRMWAGSRIEFRAALPIGAVIQRRSRVAAITPKHGASGSLVFVEVEHVTLADGEPAIAETQSIVYREATVAEALPKPGPGFDQSGWDATRRIVPDAPLLFRYSALTFNSHRIHYDFPYVTDVEGYRGLVVHGPLTATLLLDLARREWGDNAVRTFRFRGTSPAIGGEELILALRKGSEGIELKAFAGDGRVIMDGVATV